MNNATRFAMKPGVLPGKPISIGTLDDLRHVARIEARQAGIKLDCRKLTTVSARLAVGFFERCHNGSIEQHGRTVAVRIGGAR